MTRRRILRLACGCGRVLADVVPADFSEGHPDRQEVLNRLMVNPRPKVKVVVFRPANTHTTAWLAAHPEELHRLTFGWTCPVCSRRHSVKLTSVEVWWEEADRSERSGDPLYWPATRVLDA